MNALSTLSNIKISFIIQQHFQIDLFCLSLLCLSLNFFLFIQNSRVIITHFQLNFDAIYSHMTYHSSYSEKSIKNI